MIQYPANSYDANLPWINLGNVCPLCTIQVHLVKRIEHSQIADFVSSFVSIKFYQNKGFF